MLCTNKHSIKLVQERKPAKPKWNDAWKIIPENIWHSQSSPRTCSYKLRADARKDAARWWISYNPIELVPSRRAIIDSTCQTFFYFVGRFSMPFSQKCVFEYEKGEKKSILILKYISHSQCAKKINGPPSNLCALYSISVVKVPKLFYHP